MKALVVLLFIFSSLLALGQDISSTSESKKRLAVGFNIGLGGSYTDKAYLVNFPASVTIEYSISKEYFIQFAPKYIWLLKWNEHYLSLPIHVGRKFGKRLSLYAGPTLTYDIGFFQDIGISTGVSYHLNDRSAINLSILTFTLHNYDIDYLFVPLGLSYSLRVNIW